MKITKRKITKKIKEEILARDEYCIICGGQISHVHHVFYGIEKILSKNRNDLNQLVGLCYICHDILHFRGGNNYREECKNYLKRYYE